jgi:hypothetical protein
MLRGLDLQHYIFLGTATTRNCEVPASDPFKRGSFHTSLPEGSITGSLIQAKCGCGFASKEFPQGGGFGNFMVVDMEPAYCGKCRELVVLNYKEPHPRCPQCNGAVT